MRKIILFTFLFQLSLLAIAGHRPGGSYTWTCIGPNTYKIRYTALVDCAHSPDATTKFCFDGSLAGDPNNAIYTPGLISASTVPHAVAFCSGVPDCVAGGDYNWLTELVYEQTITLVPPISPSYTISFCDGGNRPNGDNFGVGTGTSFYNEATFNVIVPCNSSAYPTSFPDAFYCTNAAACITNNFVDPDGDSLSFSLGNCLNAAGISLTYNVPYSGTNPLNSTSGWSVSPQGNICFFPTIAMKGPICMQVKEYRAGVLIATTTQDIVINIIDCAYALTGPTITSITSTNVTCFGGSTGTATVTASGGGTPYTYSWAPSGGTAATASGLPTGTYTVTVSSSGGCSVTGTVVITQPSSPVTVAMASTNVLCNGAANGTATATPIGGTPGYTYLWSPSGGTGVTASALASGSYTVTVKDINLCQTTASLTITQPTVLTTTITTSTNVSCFGGTNGSATVSATGGTSPYTYSWNSTPVQTTATVTNLPAGSYTVTVTDSKGCTSTKPVTITQPAAITLTTTQTNVSCFNGTNGTASVTVTGGTPGYTYSWTPSGGTATTTTSRPAGTYTVTVTDSKGCTASASVTITQPAAVSLTLSSTGVSCFGGNNGTATVSAAGGTPGYTYSWAPSGGTSSIATNLIAGAYTVTVNDSKGCTGTASVTIAQPILLSATTTTTNVSCNGGNNGTSTATTSGGTAPYSYLWSPGGSTLSTATGLSAGSYTVTITDNTGCIITRTVTITQPTPVSASVTVTNVSCNAGANGTSTVTASGGTSPYTYSWSTSPMQTGTTATTLLAGTYTVTITDSKGCIVSAIATITQPPVLSATITSSTNVSCFAGTNGSATVSAGGGTPGYTYSWIPSGGTAATTTSRPAGTYTITVTDSKGCTGNTTIIITQPAAISLTVSSTIVSCFGGNNGTATVSVAGGTPGYTYSWAPSGGSSSIATNLTQGSYTVTITDSKGCTGTASVTITQPIVLSATTTTTNVSCNGGNNGTATATASGGTLPYSYLWSPGGSTLSTATGLSVGSYTVTITDNNGCIITRTVTITQPTSVTATVSVTNVSCNGGNNGTATVTASGGTSPYTYSWSTSPIQTTITATSLAAASYTVTVTDSKGCSASAIATITQPPALSATITSSTNVSCFAGTNGSATVSVGGGSPGYTYNWIPSGGGTSIATNLAAGTYTVNITDTKGCTISASVTITQPALLSTTVTTTSVSCNGGSNGSATVTAVAGSPGYTYSWSPSGGSSSTASGLTAGNYTVTVTDNKGCQTTVIANVSQPSGMTLTTSSINATCSSSNGQASVSVTGGNPGYTYSWNSSPTQTTSTATGLPAGSYIITVTDASGCIKTATVIVSNNAAPTASITSTTQVSCNGGSNGSATANVTGGTSPYTYNWSLTGGSSLIASGLSAGTFTLTATDANGCIATAITTITQPTALSLTTSQTNVSCNGGTNGTASVVASGGSFGYSYSWSPSGGSGSTAIGLASGSYTVTVTDNKGCIATASVFITQPLVLSASTTINSNVSCNGGSNGSANVSATGGTAGYIYSWSPTGGSSSTALGLSAGSYTVTVTDSKGCQTTAIASITQPAPIVIAISSTNVSCFGGNSGSATATASSGTGPYTYFWTPIGTVGATASGLTSGTYTVTVTDANSCQGTSSVTITQPTLLTVSTTAVSVSCFGGTNGSANATVSGGSPSYSYSWSTVPVQTTAIATGLSVGTYTVTITDSKGCITAANTAIAQPTPISLTTSQTNISCNGGSNGSATVSASGGTPGYTYNWTPTGGTSANAAGLIAVTYTVTLTDTKGCTASASVTITQPTLLASSIISSTNVSCNGGNNGSATASASGGTPGYTYNWMPSGGTSAIATGLAAGSYTATITDSKGCTSSSSVVITQPASLSGTVVSTTNVSCNGGNNGTATITASGGTSPYTYFWSPFGGTAASATSLTAGTYTVTINDAKGCSATLTTTITQPLQLTAGITSTNVVCNAGNNGTATVTPAGGTSPYTYSWSTVPVQTGSTAVNLSAGTYTVTVTDVKGCTAIASVNITQPTALVITNTQVNVSCNGGSNGTALVNVSGGTPGYTYNWTPSGGSTATGAGLAAGTYTVIVTDAAGCTGTSSVTITQPPALSATIAINNQVSCNGGNNGSATASASGGTPGYTYNWAPSGGTSAIATGLAAGSNTATITDSKGCTSSSSVVITQPASLSGTVVSTTNVSCNGGNNGTATITASGGTSPYTYFWSPFGGRAASASSLTAGTYTVTINDAKGCSATLTTTITQPLQLTAGITSTNVVCNAGNNGTATVTPAGGTPPYTYSWSTVPVQTGSTAVNLSAGTYTVTVTDVKGCTAIASVNITQPTALVITSTQVNVSCNGGSNGTALVNVSGGTPGYTYNWTPLGGSTATGTGLAAGTYTVIVTDAAGCTGTSSVTITQPPALSATIAINNQVSCNGGNNGSATASASGGTPGYTYNWAPTGLSGSTESGLGAGTYTVTTMDSKGCQQLNTLTITQPSALTITLSSTNVSCNGGSNGTASASVAGGTSPYTYQWLPSGGTAASASGLIAGTYTITATDAKGCIISSTIIITQPATLSLTLTSSSNVTCFASCNGMAQVLASGGTTPYSYLWSPGGQSSASVNNLCAGTHTVIITDVRGCLNSITVTITQPTAITSTNTITNVNCNNACNGSATVVASGGVGPYSFLWNPGFQTTPNVIGMCAGIYTVTITDASGCFVNVPIAITQPTATTLTTTTTSANCGTNNGDACVTVAGGAPPYTYQWNDPLLQTTPCAASLTGNSYTVTVNDANGCVYQSVANVNNISGPSVTISASTNITCAGANNGTATASISGGTPPYTILWSPSGQSTSFASGLGSGINTITVTDNAGCVSSASVTITQPSVLGSAITSSANVTCNGLCNGSATVATGGGVSPYSYSWNSTPVQTTPTATGLCAGGYTVTVTDANGCSRINNITITQPTVISIAVTSVTNVSCNGGNNGSVQVLVTGGTPGYTYLWSPLGGSSSLATGLSVGSYTLTITDVKGCTASATYFITQPTSLSSSIAQTNITCNGNNNGTASVIVNGGSPGYTYFWSPSGGSSSSINSLAPGSYIVTAADANGCTIQDTAIITEPSPLFVNVSSTIVTCFGGNNGSASAIASGGTSGYSYSWNSSPVQTTATAINLTAGSYTVTVTDANGCAEQEETDVFQNSAVTVSSVSSPVSCNGGNNGSVSAIVSGGTPGYAYLWIPGGASTSTINGLAAGTYSVTVTDALGCIGTATATITQPSLLTASATIVSNVSCNGGNNGALFGSATGGTSGYFYSWSPSGGTTPNATNLFAGTYILTTIDANNCQDTTSVNIIEPSLITATISQTNVSCFGGSNGSASAAVAGGTPGYTYLWSPVGGSGATASGLAAGSYTLTVTDNNACTKAFPLTITQPQLLVASISANTNLSCFGTCDGTAIASATDGIGPYSYLWLPVSVSSASVNNLCAGSYTIIVTDNNGCQSMDSLIINQPAAISNVVTSTNVNCFGSCDGTAGMATSGGVGPYTFFWSPGGQASPFVSSLCANTYTVVVTDNNGCTQSAIIPISEPSAILNTITIDSATCGTSNGSLVANTSGGTPPYSYQWNDPLLQTSATASNLAGGNYTVIITDANGCVFTGSATVLATTSPLITSITGISPSCYGTPTGSASATAISGALPYTYLWNDPFNQTNSTATGLAAGTYVFTVTDNNGCSVSTSISLTQPTQVQTIISANDSSLCYGQSVQMFCSGVGGNPGYTYYWSTGYVGPGPVTYSPASATIYSVYAVDASGCQSVPAAITVTVGSPITATAPNVSACSGQPAIITATAAGGTSGPYTYTWSNGYVGQNQSITLFSDQTYIVTIGDGCSSLAFDTVVVTVNPVAVGSMILSDTSGCEPFTIQLTGSSDIGTTYTWNFEDGSLAVNGANVPHTYASAGSYFVTLTITTATGCQSSITNIQPVTVKPSPNAYFSVSPSILPIPNATDVSFTNLSTGAINYIWNFGDGNTSTAVNPTHYYSFTGDYLMELIAVNSFGCSDTFSLKSTSENYIHFANAFTPNPNGGNGGTYNFYDLNNDVFFPTSAGVEEFHLVIYSKWGEIIFESFDINKGWDGYYKGKLCEQDVYVWKAFAKFKDGSKYVDAGDVTLMR